MKKNTSNLEVQFPKKVINFWNKDAPTISMVNPQDFHKQGLLHSLGIGISPLAKSLGATGVVEIKKRQRIVSFLMKQPGLRNELLEFLEVFASIPKSGQRFLDYYKDGVSETEFWFKVESMKNSLGLIIQSGKTVPKEIIDFQKFLSETHQAAITKEVALVGNLSSEIKKAAKIAGQIKISFDSSNRNAEITSSSAYGYKKHAYGLSEKGRDINLPAWTQGSFGKYSGVKFLTHHFSKIVNKRRKVYAYSNLLIKEVPASISKAILNFVSTNLKFPKPGVASESHIELYFSYNEKGLRLYTLDFYSSGFQYKKNYESSFDGDVLSEISESFEGFSITEAFGLRRKAHKARRYVNAEIDRIPFKLKVLAFIKSFNLTNGYCLESKSVDKDFKWYALERITEQGFYDKDYDEVTFYRKYVSQRIIELREVSEIVDILQSKSLLWDLPLHLPKIVKDGHIVSFKKLYPVHLIGRKNTKKIGDEDVFLESADLRPVQGLPKLNGQMISLTGQNAGGKTVTEETYINSIFLAQSGLPVFGEGMELNPKTIIAMVFMERGDGSTLQILLEKVDNVLEAVSKTKKEEILTVIDELGTGTQESLGLITGKKILEKLSNSKTSVLFSTQITELAKHAEEELNTISYKFDIDYNITSGIGTGGVDNLIEKLELKHL